MTRACLLASMLALLFLLPPAYAQGGPLPPVGIAKPAADQSQSSRSGTNSEVPQVRNASGPAPKKVPVPVPPAPSPRVLPPEDDRRR